MIASKINLSCYYNGFYRECSPHALGYKDGKLHILCNQFGGNTSKGPITNPKDPNNWKCFVINKMSNLEIVKGEWHTGSNHSRPQNCIDNIICEIEY